MTTATMTDISEAWAALVECQRAFHAAHVQRFNAINEPHKGGDVPDGWHEARAGILDAEIQLRKDKKRAAMGASAPAPHATDLELYERATQERTEGETAGDAMFRIATSAKPATQVERPNPATVTHNASTLADARMKDERIRDLEKQVGEHKAQAGLKPWASMSEGERSRWVSQAVYEAATRREAELAQAAQQDSTAPSMPAWADLSTGEQSQWISERVYESVRARSK